MEQKLRNDRKAKRWVFSVGEPIFAKNFDTGCRWLPGNIKQRAGPVYFRVRLEDGRFHRCHQDQLRHREVQEDTPDTSDSGVDDSNLSPIPTPVSGDNVTPPVADTDSPEMVSTYKCTNQGTNRQFAARTIERPTECPTERPIDRSIEQSASASLPLKEL